MTLLQALITRTTVIVDVATEGRSGLRITYRRSGKVSVRIGEVITDRYGCNYLGEQPKYHLDLVPAARYKQAVEAWRYFAEHEWADYLARS